MLLPQVIFPRQFHYVVDDTEDRAFDAHLCVAYPTSPSLFMLYFFEVSNGDLILKKVATRVTEFDGGVLIRQ